MPTLDEWKKCETSDGKPLPAEKCDAYRKMLDSSYEPSNKITGLGDVIHVIAHATGLDKIADGVAKALGKDDCGCAARRKKLNEKLPLP